MHRFRPGMNEADSPIEFDLNRIAKDQLGPLAWQGIAATATKPIHNGQMLSFDSLRERAIQGSFPNVWMRLGLHRRTNSSLTMDYMTFRSAVRSVCIFTFVLGSASESFDIVRKKLARLIESLEMSTIDKPVEATNYGRNLARELQVQRREDDTVEFRIRDATEADLSAIVDIYNQSIPAGWSTADTNPITVADRVEWFRKFDPSKRPIWVAETDAQVIATTYLSSFYAGRPAYDATAEMSVYVASALHKKGIGRRLKEFVISQCPRLGVTTLLSMHFDHNLATRHINETLGFEVLGHLTEIAVVQGQQRGLVISALRIPPKNAEPGNAAGGASL